MHRPTTLGLAALTALAVLVLAFALLNRRDEVVGLAEEIQYEDIAFSVLAVQKEEAALRVTLKVSNHAKQVAYRFDPSVAILVDREWHEVRSVAGGPSVEISAGDSHTTDLVFETREVLGPRLRISPGGNPLFDLLDALFWGAKLIRL
jgi:hypothetical protein